MNLTITAMLSLLGVMHFPLYHLLILLVDCVSKFCLGVELLKVLIRHGLL